MKTMSNSFVAVALLVGLAGCHHMSYATIPGELVADSRLPSRDVGQFEITVGEHYLLWGLAKVSDEKVARAVVEKVREMGGNGVRDLHYRVQMSFLDMCLSACGHIVSYHTQTVVVTGTVVQITGGSAERAIPLERLQAVADGKGALEIPISYR
ncbi:MAG: hypothetical protein JXR83_14575 [Deltaproteobacteria bacterium]|nr:hypothetical protein [Deltaproteobacteria bacterium]